MKEKIINVLSNANYESRKTSSELIKILQDKGFSTSTVFDNDAELTICIGGDGIFLKATRKDNFSSMHFVGINTGHLGFYQEVKPEFLEEFVDDYINENYRIDELKIIGAEVFTKNRTYRLTALNEIVLKAQHSKMIHLNMFIDKNHVERFSGDGILVCTPSGSTAYNFSSSGAIIYPNLNVIEVTPLAPVYSAAYRVLQSSLIIPGDFVISLLPDKRYANSNLLLVDGNEYFFSNLKKVNLRLSNKTVKKLIFSKESYWDNLKSKFL